MTETPLLELRQVTRIFKLRKGLLSTAEAEEVRAVDAVSLWVKRGEILGLVGESGCGKSTLARLVVRLLRPTSGEIVLEGRPYGREGLDKAFARSVQMVFQDPFSSLDPRQKIGAAIAEPLAIHGARRKVRRQRVAELLGQVGLSQDVAGRYPHEFSGGQRQRIAIARALALKPQLLVCDEPVSALDVSIQAQVLNLLLDLRKELQLTYLFISHDLSVVGYLSDRVAVMRDGRVLELAATREIFANPLHPYTRELLAAVPEPVPRPEFVSRQENGNEDCALVPPKQNKGCAYAFHCTEAQRSCEEERPVLRDTGDGHWVACFSAASS